jgi:hypothetical protein
LYASLGLELHMRALEDLCRVARQVRVFPLVQLDGQRSPYLMSSIDRLTSLGHSADIVVVPYEFQRGAKEMLRVVTRQ